MQLARARAIVDDVVANASGPVSVFVADPHGELVAAATMDGAAPDTRLNAQRKAYTAARSDATSTRELAEKARADPVERASFDPFFTFFLGGVAVFEDGRRVGAVGVSGLPGEVDEQLALAAIERTTTATVNAMVADVAGPASAWTTSALRWSLRSTHSRAKSGALPNSMWRAISSPAGSPRPARRTRPRRAARARWAHGPSSTSR